MRSYGNIGIIFSSKWTRRMLVTYYLSNTNIEGKCAKYMRTFLLSQQL